MGIASPRIIVVDDKREHGEAVVRKLWELGHASLYVEYDQRRLLDGYYGPFSGVRLVFMDLDLAGEGRIGDGSRAYADVLAVINHILHDNNGPWALVTWTGHADHAEQLWNHLGQRLPANLRPLSRQVMDKEVFLGISGREKDPELGRGLQEVLDHQDAVKCLLSWESGVLDSANKVIADLVQMAATLAGESSENLGALLFELARAEGGKKLELSAEYSGSLYKVLTSLLSDRLASSQLASGQCSNTHIRKHSSDLELSDWKRRINTMLNLEMLVGSADKETAPGVLTRLPDPADVQVLKGLSSDKDLGKFIRRHFLDLHKSTKKPQKKGVSDGCELLLLDTTPPCDHAQRKSIWRKFVVACLLPVEHICHAWVVDHETGTKQPGRLKGEFLRMSPEFSDEDGGFVFIVNANLQLSFPEDQLDKLGEPRYRVREPMLADWMGWFGRHVTRLGHVWLSVP